METREPAESILKGDGVLRPSPVQLGWNLGLQSYDCIVGPVIDCPRNGLLDQPCSFRYT